MDQMPEVISPVQLKQEEGYLYDSAAERTFLALLMHNPYLIEDAEQRVPVECIFYTIHNYIYRVMMALYEESTRRNLTLIFDDHSILRVSQHHPNNAAYMAQPVNMQQVRNIMVLSQTVNPDQYGSVVAALVDASDRVKVYRECRSAQKRLFDKTAHPEGKSVAIDTEHRMLEIALNKHDGKGRIKHILQDHADIVKRANLQAIKGGDWLFNIPCKRFPYWMKKCNGGFRRGNLIFVASRTKVGKSQFLQNIGTCCSYDHKIPVLYIDSEMSYEEMYFRTMSQESQIPEYKLRDGMMTTNEYLANVFDQATNRMSTSPFYYADVTGQPIDYAISLMRQFRRNIVGDRQDLDLDGKPITIAKPGLIIFDWIKVGDMSQLNGGAKEWQILGQLASKLKDTAKEIDLPVIAAAQTNRLQIGMTGADIANHGEGLVAGSDRLAQFCNMLCILRNVTNEEEFKISEEFGAFTKAGRRPKDADEDGKIDYRNTLLFNQVLHVPLQRGGSNIPDGIPMYLFRGKSVYEEVVNIPKLDSDGNGIMDEYGNPQTIPTDEVDTIGFLRALRWGKQKNKGKKGDSDDVSAGGVPQETIVPSTDGYGQGLVVMADQGKGNAQSTDN